MTQTLALRAPREGIVRRFVKGMKDRDQRRYFFAILGGKLLAVGSTQTYNSSGIPILQPAMARYELGTTPVTQRPYGGSPQLLPGAIGIGTFDEGGEGVAYHDTDAINYGGSKARPGTGVAGAGPGGAPRRCR